MREDKAPDVFDRGLVFPSTRMAASREPNGEAFTGCAQRLIFGPGQNSQRRGEFASGSDEAEAPGHGFDLSICTRRNIRFAELLAETLDEITQFGISVRTKVGDIFKEFPNCYAIVAT